MRTTTGSILGIPGTLLARPPLSMSETWAYDRIFDELVRELTEERSADVELASTARREMADIKRDERSVGDAVAARARSDRATFAQMLRDARERSGGSDVEVSYDSADPNQERQADLVARYLVSLGYAEMRTEEAPPGHAIYRARFFWDKLRRWHESGE
jgi:hypothetical protein